MTVEPEQASPGGPATDPWVVLQGDAKSYLTLAAGLIGVTATFAERLVSGDQLGRAFVFLAWGCLGIAIGAATFASGGAFNGASRREGDYSKVCGRLNAAVIFIGLGVGLLALAAWRTSIDQDESEATGARSAREFVADMAGSPIESVTVKAYAVDGGDATYTIELSDTSNTQAYRVVVDESTSRVLEAKEQP